MKKSPRYRVWWIGCCLSLFLTACAKREAAQPDATTMLASSPAAIRSFEPAIPEAVNRVFQRSCQTCHGPAGQGILAVAPDVRQAKSRSPEQWKQFLRKPQGGHPGADLPPPTWLNEAEIELMAEYLANLTAANPPLAAPSGQRRPASRQGRVAR